ncbi:MAG TPA: BolA family transcriptional regulator [Thiotrichaceae bacterium]|jgi:BolA protein|nr:BolA family transcriptional regulator [Thiotrichaceae bacterium]HIM07800.1 BolA family transcriptional regulator [Gammaproteobacteria bacterium]
MDRIAAIRERLTKQLMPTQLDIIDESHLHAGHAGAASGAGHFAVTITANAFNGKSLIEQHRLVYQAVDDLMRSEIHALSIKAIAADENA